MLYSFIQPGAFAVLLSYAICGSSAQDVAAANDFSHRESPPTCNDTWTLLDPHLDKRVLAPPRITPARPAGWVVQQESIPHDQQVINGVGKGYDYMQRSLCTVQNIHGFAYNDKVGLCRAPDFAQLNSNDEFYENRLRAVNDELYNRKIMPLKFKPVTDNSPHMLAAIYGLEQSKKNATIIRIGDLRYAEYLNRTEQSTEIDGSVTATMINLLPSATPMDASDASAWSQFNNYYTNVHSPTSTINAMLIRPRQTAVSPTTIATTAPSLNVEAEIFLIFKSAMPELFSVFSSEATSTMEAAPPDWTKAVSSTYLPGPFVGDDPIRIAVFDRAVLDILQTSDAGTGITHNTWVGLAVCAASTLFTISWL